MFESNFRKTMDCSQSSCEFKTAKKGDGVDYSHTFEKAITVSV